jgi:hypothetical protein
MGILRFSAVARMFAARLYATGLKIDSATLYPDCIGAIVTAAPAILRPTTAKMVIIPEL